MNLRPLKYITATIIALALFFFMSACNDESGNNSTTTTTAAAESDTAGTTGTTHTVNAPTDSITGMATTGVKKKGKVSAQLDADANANGKIEMDKQGYYNRTEVMPAYKGGQSSLESYITNNIEYPQDAIDNNADGTVSVQFVVDEQGNISNIKAVGNKIGYGLEEEAVRVISKMPKWSPGQVKGKNVKTWRTLPITYRLES